MLLIGDCFSIGSSAYPGDQCQIQDKVHLQGANGMGATGCGNRVWQQLLVCCPAQTMSHHADGHQGGEWGCEAHQTGRLLVQHGPQHHRRQHDLQWSARPSRMLVEQAISSGGT